MSDFIPVSFCTFRSPIVIWGSQHLGEVGELNAYEDTPKQKNLNIIDPKSKKNFFLL